jgi:hypothetical protein
MFDQLRCDTCGTAKSVGHDEVAEHFQRFVKGMEVRYTVATGERDNQIMEDPDISPMSEDEFEWPRCQAQIRIWTPGLAYY